MSSDSRNNLQIVFILIVLQFQLSVAQSKYIFINCPGVLGNCFILNGFLVPSTYLPKEYFLSNGRRDPRHAVPGEFQSTAASTTSTTYHLNPQAPGNSLGLETTNNNNNANSAIHAMNNEFGIRLVPHSQVREGGVIERGPSGGGASTRRIRRKLNSNNNKQGTRVRRRLSNKSLLRPPKEYIIYSLPEQSFWAPDGVLGGTAEERSIGTGGGQGGRSEGELAEEEEGAPLPTPGHLRAGGFEEDEELRQQFNRGDNNGNGIHQEIPYNHDEEPSPSPPSQEEIQRQTQQEPVQQQLRQQEPLVQQQQQQAPEESPEEKEVVVSNNNVVDLNDAPNPSLSERKVLLGQCMRSCIDALL